MISLSEARTACVGAVSPLPIVRVPLLQALGRFLAEPVVATRSLPGCDNSAMDGFAVRAAETRGATRDAPARFRVVGVLYAGMAAPDRALGPGEAYRIFTGAPVPAGADTVVRQEAGREVGERAFLFVTAEPGENVRRRGEEFVLGQPMLPAGLRVDSALTGVLASLGQVDLAARPRPRVGVLTLGDELVALGERALPHQVYESNGTLLAAMVAEAGAEVVALRKARDHDEEIRAELERLLSAADLVVTSGGASVGDKDRSKQVLKSMGGVLTFDGVAIKPGKPAGLAQVSGVPVVVLPGNPGAAMVGFDQFARPMLLALQGALEERRRVRARLDLAKSKQPGLTYLYGAALEQRGSETWANTRTKGSGQIFQNVGIEGWALLPRGVGELASGEEVEVELFHGARYSPAGRRP
ncbi:MAG: molybdopterin molybdotransferase MoeA [Myxococcaceae bacterium]